VDLCQNGVACTCPFFKLIFFTSITHPCNRRRASTAISITVEVCRFFSFLEIMFAAHAHTVVDRSKWIPILEIRDANTHILEHDHVNLQAPTLQHMPYAIRSDIPATLETGEDSISGVKQVRNRQTTCLTRCRCRHHPKVIMGRASVTLTWASRYLFLVECRRWLCAVTDVSTLSIIAQV
jgi:hypothetical protein